jgi:hypothetical protein
MSPLFAGTPVALVDEEPITMRDLTRLIASVHADTPDQPTDVRKDYARLLDRVITTRLIVQEARDIGLDELPAVAEKIEDISSQMLIEDLMASQLRTVEVDPEEAEQLYRRMSRELLLTSLVFGREEDARDFAKEYESGADFEELARRFIDEGRAQGDLGGTQYDKLKDLRPRIAQEAFDMEVGALSSISSIPEGSLVFHLGDERFYEDEALRRKARRTILEPLQRAKAREYFDFLLEKYWQIDRRLLKRIDFEKEKSGFLWWRVEKPVDFQKLLEDERVLATAKGEEPSVVTVGDLAARMQKRRFHGVEKAAARGELNREKWPLLEDILLKRAAVREAVAEGRDRDPDYLDAVAEATNGLLFDTFVAKVIAPDIKLSEQELRDYYREHLDDFSTPTMLRVNGIGFYEKSDAEKALAKLRKGADAKWVSANSPGQIDRKDEAASLFKNALLSVTAMPEELRDAAETARPGDALLYSSPENHHYVVTIEEVFPSRPQAYESARESIAKILWQKRLGELIDDWSEKLREAYETRIFVTGLGD